MPLKSFDPEQHVYKSGDTRLPGATDVIKSQGLIELDWCSPLSRYRGKAVHEGVRLLNKGTLDWKTVSPEFAGYLKSYQAFLRHTRYQIVGYETPLITDTFGCIPDIYGYLDGEMSIVEVKTGALPGWISIQTALQAIALEKEMGFRIQRRYGLRLMQDGSMPKLKSLDDPNDSYIAQSMVAIFHWKLNHKINPWRDEQ